MWFRLFTVLAACAASALARQAEWVERSNQNAALLLSVLARYSPESAAQTGVEGVDEEIFQPTLESARQAREATRKAAAALRARLENETGGSVREDLEILIQAAELSVRSGELQEKYLLPYLPLGQTVFGGIRALLDDQVAPARRPAALVRLRKYAGAEPGFRPVAALASERIQEAMRNPALLGPFRDRLQKDIAQTGFFLDGIGQLFQKFGIAGYEEPLAALRRQVASYNDFLSIHVLPRARTDFRLPPELYANHLLNAGVGLPPAELAAKAHAAFDSIQTRMRQLAPRVAKKYGWQLDTYQDVIRQLKKDQLAGDAILTHYRGRLKQIEQIIRRHDIVTLPAREARIRLASAAESAAGPAPNMRPPRLVGNTGESGEFVLPLNVPDTSGKMQSFDDFTFAAASWTLTVHEARPGHELQFAAMVEKGVSQARAIFAFNSANVEGWGLYAESVMEPYLPVEGQLIALQHRLLRAARAYLDPELQSGKVTAEQAGRILREEVVLSPAMANQEVERYTYRMPGQATAYFYGYTRLLELQAELRKKLGSRFKPKEFHDFLLAQGLLPPAQLREACLRWAAKK
jgi:uncharacterized protein (DUF885 family)